MTSEVRNTPGGELSSTYEGFEHKQDAPDGPDFEVDNCSSCEAIKKWSLTGHDDKDWVKAEIQFNEDKFVPESTGSREVLTNVCIHVKTEDTTDPLEDISISPPVMADAPEESRASNIQLSTLSSDRSTLMDSTPYPTRVAKSKPAESSTLQSTTDPRKVLYKCTICQKIFPDRCILLRHQETHPPFSAKQRATKDKSLSQSQKVIAQSKAESRSTSQSQNLTMQSPPDTRETTSKNDDGSESLTQLKHHDPSNQEPLIGGSLWKCPECEKRFTSAALLTVHQLVHSIKTPYSCNICRKLFISFHHLQKHRKSRWVQWYHSTGSYGKSKITKKQCTAKGRNTPLKVLEQQMPALCVKGSPAKRKITKQQCKGIGEKTLSCTSCDKSFKTRGLLRNHKCKKNPTDWAVNTCEICGKQFRDPSYLVNHRRTHTGEKPYQCDVCGRGFTYAGLLKQHQIRHNLMKFTCKLCGKAFGRLLSFDGHKQVHARDKLSRHMELHSKERPFKCALCNKRFKQPGSLRRHKAIHARKKPYKCLVCGEGFLTSANLQTHKCPMTREKPYLCHVCGEQFAMLAWLNSHLRVHPGETLHKCTACGKEFRWPSQLSIHKCTHKERSHSCSVRSHVGLNLMEEPSAKISKADKDINENNNSDSDGSCIVLSDNCFAGSPTRSVTSVRDVAMVTDGPKAMASTANQRDKPASHGTTNCPLTASQWPTYRVTYKGYNLRDLRDKKASTAATVAPSVTYDNHDAAYVTHSDTANHRAVPVNDMNFTATDRAVSSNHRAVPAIHRSDNANHGALTANHGVDTAHLKALTAKTKATPELKTVSSQKQHSQVFEPDPQLIAESGGQMSPEGPEAGQSQTLSADMRARLVEMLRLVPCSEFEAIACEAGHSLPRRQEERARVTRANPALREELHSVVHRLYASLPESQGFSVVGMFSERQQIFVIETLTALIISKYGTKKWSMVDIFASIRRLWENERSKNEQKTAARRGRIKEKGTPRQ